MHRPVLLLLCAVSFSGPGTAAAPPAPGPARAADTRALVRGNTRFALELYGQLRGRQGNLFISPFSISTALAMTSAGAKGNTLAEMQQTLHLPGQDQLHPALGRLLQQARQEGRVELLTASALWGQKGHPFLPELVQRLKKSYQAGLNQVDFATNPEASRKSINGWVARTTRNRVKDLVPAGVIHKNTRLVLTNAIYFQGTWASIFPADSTQAADFLMPGGDRVRVKLMRQRGKFRYHEQKDMQALEMPYGGGNLSMVVILPRSPNGLARIEKLLEPDTLERLLFNMRKRRVYLMLPRFKLASGLTLKKELSALGMSLAFSDSADLSGLDGGKEPLALDEVVHKAEVEVNEKGTKASAGTGVVVGSRSIETLPLFRADRPFVFLIRDSRSGSLLFLGRLVAPGK
jgi:serpin B